MKIAIGICGKTSEICSSMGCFKAYNNSEKHFEVYRNIDTELLAFFSCHLCFEDGREKLEKIATRLQENKVENVHFGKCAVKCKDENFQEIKKIFTDLNLQVIEGTH